MKFTVLSKKHRKTALCLTVLWTAVFYASCGSGELDNSMRYTKSENYRQEAANADDAADADFDSDFAEDGAGIPEEQNAEEYSEIVENGFVSTAEEPVSTFSIDVDTASYANIRRMIQDGYLEIPKDAVRIEEMINYFDYVYPSPTDDAPFSVTTELSSCPWNPGHDLLLVGLQAEKMELEARPPMNLVFLIDVSGSMAGEDRLGLVQQAMDMLTANLQAEDTVSIVTYAGREAVVLEGASGGETELIMQAMHELEAGGSTAGGAGIIKAYEIAEKFFIPGGNNRILLATDGDLNVGLSSAEELKALVEEKRESGVNLSVLGFGSGNLKDDRLETLADYGNGNYSYIDSEREAEKVLVQEMCGTLYTVAKDVKLQLAFSPDTVQDYRLIGYENRVLANEDFSNDKVDAGEIGAGHSVTALYEIIPTETPASDNLLTLSMRYKQPDGDQSLLKEYPVTVSGCRTETIGKNAAFAGAVAEFGMLLRSSDYSGTASGSEIRNLLGQTDISDTYREEFCSLVEQACRLGMIPESVNAASIPEEDINSESAVSESAVSADISYAKGENCILLVQYQGNTVTLPDAAGFCQMVEFYLDTSTRIADKPDSATIQSVTQNGICAKITFGNQQEIGKYLSVADAAEPQLVDAITLLVSDDLAQLLVRYHDNPDYIVYEMPEVIKDELLMQMEDALSSDVELFQQKQQHPITY